MRLLEHFEEGVQQGQRLPQFENYAIDTYRIPQSLRKVSDGRKGEKIPTFPVVLSLFHAAVFRIPSINALEFELEEPGFQRLLGLPAREGKKAFSADTISNVLDSLDIAQLEASVVDLIKKAERNKAFRDDTFGTFRVVALDGWEPFCSYKRHCDGCLTRKVKRKSIDEETGEEIEELVTQYYHRFVVAFLVAPKLDMTLAIEPIRPADLRDDLNLKEARHEGELTAALRLMKRLHKMYGRFIEAFALDGLYACGPVFEKLNEYRYGGFIICKNKKNDPYRFADEIWQVREKSDGVETDSLTNEEVEFWELKNVDALKTFTGSVDMLKAVLTRKNGKKGTWVVAKIGKAKRAGRMMTLRIMRSRWHIENTAFHQWVTKWNLDHCYRHTANAITSVMLIWSLAFNMMQLFFYRRLRKPRTGRKSSDTIIAMVKKLYRGTYLLKSPVPWHLLDDTT